MYRDSGVSRAAVKESLLIFCSKIPHVTCEWRKGSRFWTDHKQWIWHPLSEKVWYLHFPEYSNNCSTWCNVYSLGANLFIYLYPAFIWIIGGTNNVPSNSDQKHEQTLRVAAFFLHTFHSLRFHTHTRHTHTHRLPRICCPSPLKRKKSRRPFYWETQLYK